MSNDDGDRYYYLITRSKYTGMYCRYVESLKLIALQTIVVDVDDDSNFLLY
jgi:hypothetical protein